MKFTNYLTEGVAEEKKTARLEAFAGKMKQGAFKTIIHSSPIIPISLERIKKNNGQLAIWHIDTRHTGSLGGWGNQIRGIAVSYAAPEGAKRQLIINEDGKITMGYDQREWEYKVQNVPLDPKTYKADIKTLGKFFKALGAEDISAEILAWIDRYVTFPDPKKMKALQTEQDKILNKLLSEMDKLDDFYRSNRSEIQTQFKYDVKGTATYAISEFKKSISNYRLK